MGRRAAETVGHGDSVTMAAKVPAHVADRLYAVAERTGLTRAEVIRLALTSFDGDSIPDGLAEAADILRIARGTA